MNRLKLLLNLLPVVAIALVGWAVFQQWQAAQIAARPDYDNPASPPSTRLPPKPQNSDRAQVIEVQDGDTIKVVLNGRQERIRFCGIDAPELAQPGGTESRDYLRSLIAAADNTVIVMVNDVDRYGRKVAEVFISDPQPGAPDQEKLLNYELVSSGQAYVYQRYVKNCVNGSFLAQAEGEAKQARRGVWAIPNAVLPWDYRRLKRS